MPVPDDTGGSVAAGCVGGTSVAGASVAVGVGLEQAVTKNMITKSGKSKLILFIVIFSLLRNYICVDEIKISLLLKSHKTLINRSYKTTT